MATLRYELDGKAHEFTIVEASTTIGRERENGLQIKDKSMSRSHCRIERTATGHKVVDLGSRNGTFVNGVQAPERELKSGDVLKIGNIPVTYEVPAAPAPKPVKPPSPPPKPESPPPPLIEPLPEAATLDVIPEELKAAAEKPAPAPKITKRAQAEPRAPSGARKRRKPRILVIGLAVGLLVFGAVLFILFRTAQAKANHEQDVRAFLKRDIEEINALSPTDAIGRDALVEKVIANPLYEDVVPETVKRLREEHDKLHLEAEADRKAAKIVEPFLARYEKAIKSRETLDAEAQAIFDESKTLLEQYGAGAFADRLLAVRTELKGYLEKKKKK